MIEEIRAGVENPLGPDEDWILDEAFDKTLGEPRLTFHAPTAPARPTRSWGVEAWYSRRLQRKYKVKYKKQIDKVRAHERGITLHGRRKPPKLMPPIKPKRADPSRPT